MLDDGIFEFDKATIKPYLSSKKLEIGECFQIIRLSTATVYLAEVKLESISWDLRVTARRGTIRSLELRMIETPATHNHLAEKYAAHNKFLKEHISIACKKELGRTEYTFGWGSICSYMDIKTGECVILVEY